MTASHESIADAAITVRIACDLDIVTARQHGRAFVGQLGFSMVEAMLIATAISELARNIVLHADHGEIVLAPLEQDGRSGVLVIARDEGPGIADVREVLAGRSAIHLGLRGLRRLVDDVDITSGIGRGTTVAVKKWKA